MTYLLRNRALRTEMAATKVSGSGFGKGPGTLWVALPKPDPFSTDCGHTQLKLGERQCSLLFVREAHPSGALWRSSRAGPGSKQGLMAARKIIPYRADEAKW